MTRSICPAFLLSALLTLVLAAQPAEAAPQILGLVASNGLPTPLRCEGGLCSGLVNSFCLQFERPTPDADTDYGLAAGGGIALLGERADGSTVRLAADGLVDIRSRAGFSSVTVSLPESRLKTIGLVAAAIEIAPMTSLLPVAIAGDSDPQTPGQVGYATGTLRRLAQSTFETPGEKSDAARLIALVINNLPTDEPAGRVGREAVWNKAMTYASGASLDPHGLTTASSIYESCGTAVDSRTAPALGTCMEQAQRDLMGALEFEFQGQSAERRLLDDGAGGS